MKLPQKPWWWWVATAGGAGTSPIISGTAGSLVALPFAFIIHIFFGGYALLFGSLIIFLIGWKASILYLQNNPQHGEDPREIVIDEVAGQWFLLSVLYPSLGSYVVGFLLFRIFDIIKPWPVCWADQNIKGALGVMFDDILAAAYPIIIYIILILIAQALGSQALLVPVTNFLLSGYVQ